MVVGHRANRVIKVIARYSYEKNTLAGRSKSWASKPRPDESKDAFYDHAVASQARRHITQWDEDSDGRLECETNHSRDVGNKIRGSMNNNLERLTWILHDIESGHRRDTLPTESHLVLPLWKRQEPDWPPDDQHGYGEDPPRMSGSEADYDSDHHLVTVTLKLMPRRKIWQGNTAAVWLKKAKGT